MYIKFDKKLIVDIKQLKYESKKSQVNNSIEDLKTNIKKLPSLLKYFQEINIDSLKINDNEFTIFFNERHLYLDNKHINLSTKVEVHSQTIKLNLYSLYLKDLKILLNGKFKVNMYKEVANFVGDYAYKDLSGEFNIQADEKFIDFYVNTNEVKDIKFVRDFVRLPAEAEKWMYDNVTGKMKLNYFYGKLNTSNFYPVLESFKGNATIEDAKIRFHKNAKVVDTKKLTVDYKDDKLLFSMQEPSYDTTKIYGSSVVINNLTSEAKGEVVVDIKTKSALNRDILDILKAYNINLPLIQTKGTTDSSFTLVVPYLIKKGMKTTGKFLAKDAVFKLQNFEFEAKNADVELKGANVIIKNSYVKHKEMFEGVLNLNINTNTSTAKGDVNLSKVLIQSSSDKIIDTKDIKSDILVDFKNNTVLQFPTLKTNLEIKKDNILISLADLSLIYEHSSLLKKLDIKKGNISLDLIDENNITFKAFLDELNFPIEKDLKPIKKLEIAGLIKNENLYINGTNYHIILESIK
ncbi:YhdP family protein, partial [Malaciobacter mytili]|uniref:YhdP family protein n=1 Tax=Malaciobacter mytili TaxID=603050 RepID=UPI002248AD90